MACALEFLARAQRDLDHLDAPTARRIVEKLYWFASQPDPFQYTVRLSKSTIGDVRFRIGDYRAIAYVSERRHRMVIASVGHRREVYR